MNINLTIDEIRALLDLLEEQEELTNDAGEAATKLIAAYVDNENATYRKAP